MTVMVVNKLNLIGSRVFFNQVDINYEHPFQI